MVLLKAGMFTMASSLMRSFVCWREGSTAACLAQGRKVKEVAVLETTTRRNMERKGGAMGGCAAMRMGDVGLGMQDVAITPKRPEFGLNRDDTAELTSRCDRIEQSKERRAERSARRRAERDENE